MMRFLMRVFSILAVATGLSLMLFSPWRHAGVYLASTAFVVNAVAWGCLTSGWGRLMLVGLVGCWIGDVLGGIMQMFWPSVTAFGLSHIAFITAFLVRGQDPRRLTAAALGVIPITVLVYLYFRGHVAGFEHAGVAAYAVIISLMLVLAVGTSRGPHGWVLPAGAALFFVSDFFIANWRFVSDGAWHVWVTYPLYYPACTLLGMCPRVEPARKP